MTNSTLRSLFGSADPARSFAVLIRPIQSLPSAGPLANEVPSDALSNRLVVACSSGNCVEASLALALKQLREDRSIEG